MSTSNMLTNLIIVILQVLEMSSSPPDQVSTDSDKLAKPNL